MKFIFFNTCLLLLLTACQPNQSENSNNNAQKDTTVAASPEEKLSTTKTFEWDIQNNEGDEIPFSVVHFSYGEQVYSLDTLVGFVSACDLQQPEGACDIELPEQVLGYYQGFYAGMLTEGYILLNNEQLEHWQRYTDEMQEEASIFELSETL